MGYLYMLEFINGKKYIGITRQTPDARYTTHKAGIKTRKQLIHKAWAKHGDPTMTVLAELPDEELAQAEIDAIQKHKTLNPDGYNKSPGGFLPSTEQILGMSRLMRNRKTSEETRKRMSESAKQHRADLKDGTKKPDSKRSKYITMRIPDHIKDELDKLADANTRTLAAQVLHYIKQEMANEKTPAL